MNVDGIGERTNFEKPAKHVNLVGLLRNQMFTMTYAPSRTKIKFRFHIKKSVEASAKLLQLHSKSIESISLLRMLYLCDRFALEQIEQPVCGGDYLSTDKGLIVEGVNALIKGNSSCDDSDLVLWSRIFSIEDTGYISLNPGENPGDDNLCEKDEDIIKKIYSDYGHLHPGDSLWTKNTPEWKNSLPDGMMIMVEDVLNTLGKSDEEIDRIRQRQLKAIYLRELRSTK
jgi:Protein of unknown function (DUF4065)